MPIDLECTELRFVRTTGGDGLAATEAPDQSCHHTLAQPPWGHSSGATIGRGLAGDHRVLVHRDCRP